MVPDVDKHHLSRFIHTISATNLMVANHQLVATKLIAAKSDFDRHYKKLPRHK
jgi:hypothetical protein